MNGIGFWNEEPFSYILVQPHFPGGTVENHRSKGRSFPSLDSKWASPEYKSEELLFE
jgi:hypothetical protein